MPDKKQWWKIGIGAAIAGMVGIGVEEGIRRNTGNDESEQSVSVPNAVEPVIKSEPIPPSEKIDPALEQKLKDWQQTRKVKEFIDKIYEGKPFVDDPKKNLLDRYYNLKWHLNDRIGNEFFLGEIKSDYDDNGGRRVYFEVNVRKPDGEAGEDIKIEYETDGSISVQDEGVAPYVNIPSDSNMADRVIDQIHKVVRMRKEFDDYTTGGMDYPTKKYRDFLMKEGYSPEQIDYILNMKYKKPADVIREIDNK